MKSCRDIGPELDNQSRAGVVSCAAGLVMLVAPAMVLRAADGPAALIRIVLAMRGSVAALLEFSTSGAEQVVWREANQELFVKLIRGLFKERHT